MRRPTFRHALALLLAPLCGTALTALPAQAEPKSPAASTPVLFGSSNIELRVPRTGVTFAVCDWHEMEGETSGGSTTVYAQSFIDCTTSFNLPVDFTVSGHWSQNTTGPTSDPGVDSVSITDVSLTGVVPFGCTFTVTGGAPGTYDHLTAVMTLDPAAPDPGNVSLVASGVSGCSGLVANGDTFEWSGDYDVDPPL
ncbi:hypothetical protein [Actinomadura sp. 21ATH]|uniref:hypothetical protein n=1 Tax=Actinomadura sp. 21ATH TaxID=1735444 RepID=UPI0035C01C87